VLQRGYVYRWEVTGQEGRPVSAATFSVATDSQLKQLAELQILATGEDRAELLATALSYTRVGADAEALAVYERLARLVPEEPSYHKALARLYRRAGRPEEVREASIRAARKTR
jgi:Flp pilus assembly protein TadD